MALDEPYVSAIKKFEGFTPKAKWDYKQWSGGYGTRAQPGQVFDEKQADGMLRGELGQARDLVRKFRPDLQPGQEAALTSLTFNAGNKWMNSGLGQAVKAGDWNTASQRLQQYTRAGGEVLPGLVKRRQQEAQWLTGGGMLDPSGAAPPMGLGGPQQGAPVPPAANGTWTPDEVNARRRMASGMIQEGMNSAPVQHWTQGLARVIGGLSGNMWMDQANQAEREGRASAAQTMQAAMDNPNPRAGVGGMLGNVWTQDQGQKLATGMLASQIESQTPDAKLAREARQFELDNKRAVAPLNQRRLEQDVSTGDIDLELKKRELTAPKNSFQKLGPGDVLYQVNPRTGAVERVAGAEPGLSGPYKDPKQKADVEEGLRKEVTAAAKDYQTILSSYNTIKQLASKPSAAADMSMIFAFMKILDPASVVREGEFANAQNAAGVPDRVANLYNRILSGERLNDAQRADFTAQAETIYKVREAEHRSTLDRYRGISGRLQVDPRNVLPDAPGPQQAPPQGGPTQGKRLRATNSQGQIIESDDGVNWRPVN